MKSKVVIGVITVSAEVVQMPGSLNSLWSIRIK